MHRHIWKATNRDVQLAPIEMFKLAGGIEIGRTPDSFFTKPVIVTYECSKCGTQKVERV